MQHINPEIADQILSEIKKSNTILMHCHPNPDGDSLGSTLAMYHVLKKMGKEVTLIQGDSPLPKYLADMPGFNEITHKNIFEVDITKYDLYLVLDTAATQQISRQGDITFPPTLKTIIIDHHQSNTHFAQINLVIPTYAATAHMVYDLFKLWNIEITPDIAACLFTGIYTDTANFKYNLSKELLTAVGDLIGIEPGCLKIIHVMHHSNSKANIRFQAIALNSIETYFNDSIAMSCISHQTLIKENLSVVDLHTSGVADYLKSAIGWNVGIIIVEGSPQIVRVNFRSKDRNIIDVAKVAVLLGGGGHPEASGAQVSGTIEEAKQKVLTALAEAYPELSKESK